AGEEHLERALAIHDPAHLAAFRRAFDPGGVIEPRVVARAYLAMVRWHRGHPDAALAEIATARDVALELDNPYLAVVAESFGALVPLASRDVAWVSTIAQRQITFAQQHGFAHWTALGEVLAGWARAVGGEGAAGVEATQAGVAAWRATGARVGCTQ